MAAQNSNSFELVTKIAKQILPILEESRAIAGKVNNDMDLIQEQVDGSGGGKTGGTLKILKPKQFTVRSGSTRSNQDLTDQYTSVPAPTLKGIDFAISDTQKSKDFNFIIRNILQPATARLASQIDVDIMANYTKLPNIVGLPGTDPNAFSYMTNAERRLFELNCPLEDRTLVLSPGANEGMSDAMKGLFDAELTRDAVRRGELGTLSTMAVMRSNNVPTHLTGTYTTGSTPLMSATPASGAKTFTTDGWANSTLCLKAGDTFTVAGRFEVNPHTKESTGVLKRFTSQADVTSNGSGVATITVCESDDSVGIVPSGQYQNVASAVTDNDVIVVNGANAGLAGAMTEATTYSQSVAFHKNAFWSGFFPLPEATAGAVSSVQTNPDTGVSVRVIEQYDITEAESRYRLDVYHTSDVLMPECGVRLIGA
tara:strand:- start:2393 stop:3670 length:1278 start_codon:yes stop_codon:yes gene_type:complete